MDANTMTWIWLIVGVVLMVSEVVIPGLVVVFLGLTAVLVAVGRWIGWIDGLADSFTYWFVLSLVITMSLRGIVSKLTPGEISFKPVDEDKEAIGRLVDVVEDTGSDHENGRIRFRGTSWKAVTEFGQVFRGQKARIYGRKDMVWIIDPVDDASEAPYRKTLVETITNESKIANKKSRRFLVRKTGRLRIAGRRKLVLNPIPPLP